MKNKMKQNKIKTKENKNKIRNKSPMGITIQIKNNIKILK